MTPDTAARREEPAGQAGAGGHAIGTQRFRLAYRPPVDWSRSIAFLNVRRVDGIESVDAACYRRSLHWGVGDMRATGWLSVRPQPADDVVEVNLSASLARASAPILQRVRDVLDLDCDLSRILRILPAGTPMHGPMRLVGAFDGFELAVRGVVGQQISVKAARTIVARLVARYGEPLADAPAGISRVFPDAAAIAAASDEEIATLGLNLRRARTIRAIARAVDDASLLLEPRVPIDATIAALREIPGIGDWTAQYIAMRALCWPDAFPAGDLAVLRALGVGTPAQAREKARAWQPWRAYAVMNLWSSLGMAP